MSTQNEIKKKTGEYAVNLIEANMTIGIGTGSTAYWFIEALGKKVKEGFPCVGVPTSTASQELAIQWDIPLAQLNDVSSIDITIDGADEIDPQLRLIKGGGGALLQEKMVAAASKQLVIIADHTKLVDQLGKFPLPVEVIPYGWKQVQQKIRHLYQVEVKPRFRNERILTTDHGHYILDCFFETIHDPERLNTSLHNIPGVVETGLFIHMAKKALVGMPDGSIKTIGER
jgi:ribose 5-phosphate isomerase A